MRVAKQRPMWNMPIPGAVIRQRTDFGDATGYGKISGEYFTLAAGVDTTPAVPGAGRKSAASPALGFRVAWTADDDLCGRASRKR